MAKDPICGMEVNENTGLKLVKDNKTYYFCSERCLKKFAMENNIPDKEVSVCLSCGSGAMKWYKNKIFISGFVLVLACGGSYFLPFLEPFRKSLYMYLGKIWWAVLLGLILGGIIDHFVPREYVSHVLAGSRKRTVFYAVILGFLMSACSHGILALSMELHKKGASNPSVVAFLLASPWANLPVTIMLVAFFGLLKALYIIVSALIIAIITGLVYQILESRGLIEINKNIKMTPDDFSVLKDFRTRSSSYKFSIADIRGVYLGAISLADMVLWWILVGMALASLLGAYIPAHLFHKYMGPTFLGMMVTLALATVLEVCSEGTAPLAFEIYRQTMALGNAFVFLMAGVVTDYTEIGLLWLNVGKRVAIWLPIITVPLVVIFGLIANIIF